MKEKEVKSWFQMGYDKKKLESGGKGYSDQLLIKDGQEVKIRFRSDKAFCFNQHYHRGLNRYFTCLGHNCPLCERDVPKSFKAAFPVIDRTDGKMKFLVVGTRLLRMIDKYIRKFETLKDRDYEFSRTGARTDTVYGLIAEEKSKTTDKEKAMPKPDLEKIFKPKSAEEIEEQLEEVKATKEVDDDDETGTF